MYPIFLNFFSNNYCTFEMSLLKYFQFRVTSTRQRLLCWHSKRLQYTNNKCKNNFLENSKHIDSDICKIARILVSMLGEIFGRNSVRNKTIQRKYSSEFNENWCAETRNYLNYICNLDFFRMRTKIELNAKINYRFQFVFSSHADKIEVANIF